MFCYLTLNMLTIPWNIHIQMLYFLERKLLMSVLEMTCDSKVQTDHEGKQQVEHWNVQGRWGTELLGRSQYC